MQEGDRKAQVNKYKDRVRKEIEWIGYDDGVHAMSWQDSVTEAPTPRFDHAQCTTTGSSQNFFLSSILRL
jgi:hypothetical protein